mmetsp:Transcript_15759/g.44253  ORF Transcript_15759/g.44253 Transcript_15759/m.44253 type:complete len:237 (-) Transcript_15759:252-962(-)
MPPLKRWLATASVSTFRCVQPPWQAPPRAMKTPQTPLRTVLTPPQTASQQRPLGSSMKPSHTTSNMSMSPMFPAGSSPTATSDLPCRPSISSMPLLSSTKLRYDTPSACRHSLANRLRVHISVPSSSVPMRPPPRRARSGASFLHGRSETIMGKGMHTSSWEHSRTTLGNGPRLTITLIVRCERPSKSATGHRPTLHAAPLGLLTAVHSSRSLLPALLQARKCSEQRFHSSAHWHS